jgi:CHAT domain-containing protein/tetratricopeptide (TPR) repeat protein
MSPLLLIVTAFLTQPQSPTTAEEGQQLEARAARLVKEAAEQGARKDFAAEKKSRQELVDIAIKLHGDGDWRVTDARIAVTDVDRIAQMTDEQRKQRLEMLRIAKEAAALHSQGKTSEAVPLARQAVAISKTILGPDHRNTAATLNNLGKMLVAQGDRSGARTCYQEALAIYEKSLGPDHPAIAGSLNGLGVMLYEDDDYPAARSLLQRAVAMRRKIYAGANIYTADSLSHLGMALQAQGDYRAARDCYEQCLDMYQRLLGPDDLNCARTWNNLGTLSHAEGRYAAARRHYELSLDIKRKAPRTDDPDTADTLSNLSLCLEDQGDLAAARPFLERAVAISRKALGPEDRRTATYLHNLGCLFQAQGDRAAARSLLEDALAMRRKTLGSDHPDTAQSLNALGLFFNEQGDYRMARPFYEEALAVKTKVFGLNHPATATSLNNLGLLCQDQGDYTAAHKRLTQALAIREKTLGPEHPKTAASLVILGALLARQGDRLAAWERSRDGAVNYLRHIERLLAANSESEHIRNIEQWRGYFDGMMSLAAAGEAGAPSTQCELLSIVQSWKAMSGFAVRQRTEAVLLTGNAEAQAKHADLVRVRQQIANLTQRGPGREGPERYQTVLRELAKQEAALEREIGRLVEGYTAEQRKRKATVDDLANHLPIGAVLVELIKYHRFDFQVKDVNQRWQEWRYVALFAWRSADAANSMTANVALVPLGDASPIEQVIHSWRAEAAGGSVDAANDVRLRERVWEPLAKALPHGTKNLIIAPDGELSLLPFEAVRLTDGRYLIEQYQVSYLSNGRDLMPLPKLPGEQPSAAVVLADPDYDALGGSSEEGAKSRRAGTRQEGMHFTRLPGFQSEAEAVAKAWRAAQPLTPLHKYTGAEATEESLAKFKRPRLLYFITHGYFLEDLQPLRTESIGLRDFEIVSPEGPRRPLAANPEDARLRSGLALAGANQRDKRVEKGLSDGLLSARKVASLDLWRTDLVVLSACETGLGEVRIGEGVLGLRRAFQLAGAQTVLASLWKVPDAETQQLMSRFFELWLSGKIGKAAALRQAQLEVIAKLRKDADPKRQTAPPLYWAGFICHGQPD